MKNHVQNLFVALAMFSALNLQPSPAFAQGTAFTYQGRLNNNGSPAAGAYNLTFALFTNNAGGVATAGPVTNSAVNVTNGLFTVLIDFGPGVFTGATNWLQIGVATNGVSSFTALTPRQQLTPTPYAIYAGNVSAAGISGTIQTASLAGTYGNTLTFSNAANSFSGNGAGLAGVNAAALNGLNSSNFWQTAGNAGTSPARGNFVGTTDNQPLELRVNGGRALRLEPGATNGAPNVIGGSPVNFVSPGVVGAVIAGGGTTNFFGIAYTNSVLGDFSTIGGGLNNTVVNYYGTVAGGIGNSAGGGNAVVGGGAYNYAGGNYSAVGGGFGNNVTGVGAFIGGGGYDGINYLENQILGNASFIGGGLNNNINAGASYAGIVSGQGNIVDVNSSDSTVAGGNGNWIGANTDHSFIGGGNQNSMLISGGGTADVIAGGEFNGIGSNNGYYIADSVISGGNGNQEWGYSETIGGGTENFATNSYSTVGGGDNNNAGGYASVISGGEYNTASGDYAIVGGGQQNNAGGSQSTAVGGSGNGAYGDRSTVGGGNNNIAYGSSDTLAGGFNNSSGGGDNSTISGGNNNNSSGSDAVIGGGQQNYVSAFYATIGGGVNNTATNNSSLVTGGTNNVSGGYASTVAGGSDNEALGDYSFAAGNFAQATNNNSFVWSDGSTNTDSSINSQFVARASGGFVLFSSKAGTGVSLAPGSGSWSSMSDRNAKDGFTPVNSQAVLAEVAALPLTTWSYKTEPGVRHVGPMAQDFHAAFAVGEDDRHIAEVDEGGVALAAIQGLNQKLKEKDAEIQELKQRLDELEKLFSNKNQTERSSP